MIIGIVTKVTPKTKVKAREYISTNITDMQMVAIWCQEITILQLS